MDWPARRGIVFILSAPSGAGKTTLSRAALGRIGGLTMSVSLTTRSARDGEQEGTDYHFVSAADFEQRLARGELAESARVFEARYGTPRQPLEDAVSGGTDILLDIDIQGARQLRARYGADTVSIFVLPPSFAELESRLRGRGTEDAAAIARRLARAREEANAYPEYDYLIINSNVEESVTALKAVVEAERLRICRLRAGFAPWKK